MADNGDKALKLAQQNEKQIVLLWKKIARFEKTQNDWEKEQMKYIARVEKNLVDAVNAANKTIADLHAAQDKRMSELHNKQDKKFVDSHNKLVAWVNKTFDKKGIFE